MEILREIERAVIDGKVRDIEGVVQKALDTGLEAHSILDGALAVGMLEVGRRFREGEYFLPEVVSSANAMKKAIKLLEPYLAGKTAREPVGKMVIGTVKGDVHDIGKNLVAIMFQGAGFEVLDLGVDVKPDRFVQAISELGPDVVGMSALLSTTMVSITDTIEAIKASGLRSQVKIIIGGAPVTQEFADRVGADGYAPDAASAVEKARELLRLDA